MNQKLLDKKKGKKLIMDKGRGSCSSAKSLGNHSANVHPKELVEERDEIIRLITLCNDGNVNITEEKYSKVKNYLTQQRTELLEEILGLISEIENKYTIDGMYSPDDIAENFFKLRKEVKKL